MNALLAWIDERTGLVSAAGDWLRRPVAGGPAWRNVWPAAIAFTFFTQILTGLVLWMYYSPGAQTAWESVYYLQTQVQGGWLLRAIHHNAAQVMVGAGGDLSPADDPARHVSRRARVSLLGCRAWRASSRWP